MGSAEQLPEAAQPDLRDPGEAYRELRRLRDARPQRDFTPAEWRAWETSKLALLEQVWRAATWQEPVPGADGEDVQADAPADREPEAPAMPARVFDASRGLWVAPDTLPKTDPALLRALYCAAPVPMTEAELRAQRISWIIGQTGASRAQVEAAIDGT